MKKVLVTGGHRRLGRHLSLALASNGYDIVIHYRRDQEAAEATVQQCLKMGVHAQAIQGNFSSPEGIEEFITSSKAAIPDITGIIHNVGMYTTHPLKKISSTEWLELFSANIHAPMMITQAYLDSLIHHKGSIVNIGTLGLTALRASYQRNPYNLTKHALWQFTRTLAFELASDGVRVNMVSPGHLENSVDLPSQWPKGSMGRAATCEEVVHAVLFLFDPKSAFITGQNIEVAGGVGL